MDNNEVIDILCRIAPPRTSKKAFDDFMEARDMAIAALKQASLPVQSKTGHWVHDGSACYCSECKKSAHRDYDPWDLFSPSEWILSDFCPKCGADMRRNKDDIN